MPAFNQILTLGKQQPDEIESFEDSIPKWKTLIPTKQFTLTLLKKIVVNRYFSKAKFIAKSLNVNDSHYQWYTYTTNPTKPTMLDKHHGSALKVEMLPTLLLQIETLKVGRQINFSVMTKRKLIYEHKLY